MTTMIREAAFPDLDSIAELERECFPEPWDAAAIGDVANEFSHILCEGGENGEIRGYIFFDTVFDDAEILRLCVKKDCRRLGIAGELISRCIDVSKEAGCRKVLLEVRRSNAPAIALYEKNGFAKISERPLYYGSDDGLIYALEL